MRCVNLQGTCGMIQSYLFTIKTESVYPKARPFWGNFGIFTGQL